MHPTQIAEQTFHVVHPTTALFAGGDVAIDQSTVTSNPGAARIALNRTDQLQLHIDVVPAVTPLDSEPLPSFIPLSDVTSLTVLSQEGSAETPRSIQAMSAVASEVD